jgi:hypothetical protein
MNSRSGGWWRRTRPGRGAGEQTGSCADLGRQANLLNRINLICPTGGDAIFLSSPFCKNISVSA